MFKDCIHEYVVVFILIYVDNTAVTVTVRHWLDVFMRKSELMEVLISVFIGNLTWFFGCQILVWWTDWCCFCFLMQLPNKETNSKLIPPKYQWFANADLDAIPISEKPDLVYIFKFQKLIGELMFLDVNTSPEISYALSALSRYLTQATLQHGIHTKHLLR